MAGLTNPYPSLSSRQASFAGGLSTNLTAPAGTIPSGGGGLELQNYYAGMDTGSPSSSFATGSTSTGSYSPSSTNQPTSQLTAQNTGPTAEQIAAQEQAAADALARKTIEANFSDYTNALNRQKTRLGETQGVLAGRIGTQYNRNVSNLNLSKQQGQENIARAQDKVRLQGAETLKDLSSNIRSAFDAGNIRLGTSGASDSSAAGQMAYALARLQNQNRADILRQGNEQLSDLDFEERQLLQTYNSELSRLEEDKNTAIQDIALDFQSKMDAINNEMVNANIDRRTALADLKIELANEALGQISGLDRDINSYISQITSQVESGLKNIDTTRLSMTASDFAPTTQLNLNPASLQIRPSAAALGESTFFAARPRDDEQEA